jgi:hypothetical protein
LHAPQCRDLGFPSWNNEDSMCLLGQQPKRVGWTPKVVIRIHLMDAYENVYATLYRAAAHVSLVPHDENVGIHVDNFAIGGSDSDDATHCGIIFTRLSSFCCCCIFQSCCYKEIPFPRLSKYAPVTTQPQAESQAEQKAFESVV